MPRKAQIQSDRKFISLLLFLILSGVLFIVAVKTKSISIAWLETKNAVLKKESFPFLQQFEDTLARQFNIDATAVKSDSRHLRIDIPNKIHPAAVYLAFNQLVLQQGGKIVKGRQLDASGAAQIQFTRNTNTIYEITLIPDKTKPTGPRIAIVIDDFGYYEGDVVQQLLDFPYPMTYAVIPGLRKSRELATELHKRGKTIFIHLPMEPMSGKVESGDYTLLTALDEQEIRKRVQEAIKSIPNASGLNNHMGSKATADSATITPALQEIKKAGLIFLDSRTSPKSVAYQTANQLQMRTYQNNTFLDAVDEKQAIVDKLQRLAKQARAEGMAIGIGHPRPFTLAALNEIVPKLAEEGFVFVSIGDLK